MADDDDDGGDGVGVDDMRLHAAEFDSLRQHVAAVSPQAEGIRGLSPHHCMPVDHDISAA